MTGTWIAPARAAVAGLPPTLTGLDTALRTAEIASTALAGVIRGPREGEAISASLMCASAVRCLAQDDSRSEPTQDPMVLPVVGSPDPQDPDALRGLDSLLRDCLELAVEVLDNDQQELSVRDVQDIAAAVGLLDRARAACAEVVR